MTDSLNGIVVPTDTGSITTEQNNFTIPYTDSFILCVISLKTIKRILRPFIFTAIVSTRAVPSFLGLLVDVGQYVSSAASPLTHHHWDRRTLLEVLKHRQDHIGTPLKDQGHNRNALTDT